MARKLIRVTQKHISEAKKLVNTVSEYACNCPIALAAKETLNEKIHVTKEYVRFGHTYAKTSLPRSAIRFIRKFDFAVGPYDHKIHKMPKPFSFYLTLPD